MHVVDTNNTLSINMNKSKFYAMLVLRLIIRYGPLFKTSLVGRPVIISLDPEVNRFIFQQEGKLFQSWYPETAINIFGKKSLTTYNGTIHKFIRGVAAKLFGLENLKESLLPVLENSMRESFASWTGKPSVEVQDGVSDVS